jgi:glycosyltransferase involved in cell wall biosynthesis
VSDSRPDVAVFTDTYLPTVNGVTYTIETWRKRWVARDGRMDVVFPRSPERDAGAGEYPVRAYPFPFYDGFRFGLPSVPDDVTGADLVHAHTPFAVGVGGLRLARKADLPLVASYHTPTAEYADYLPAGPLASVVERAAVVYERWYLDKADAVVVPSEPARDHLRDEVRVTAPVTVVPNGVDVEFFRPVDDAAFRERYDLRGPLVGYTGRHGFEKSLEDVVEAVAGMDLDATLVFGGDGPARERLESRAADRGVDARFLGFLPREELPAFYSSLDAFLFPSPVETQGLVALEANACGTPVVGVDSGALADTVDDGETGYHYPEDDIEGFREAIRRTLRERKPLTETCLARRESMSVEAAVDRLEEVYAAVL